LRAKARYDRWDEELKFVRHEMLWSMLYFKYHKDLWLRRVEQSGSKEGHKAYAFKQANMWGRFEKEAEVCFHGKMLVV
jgi:hypothetical protein